ncbi:hypothetical protein P153DRAFT_324467 [Dothidotthia symphoricarpi CBS 119687]|uniref:Uncharacterized protein n=1 Tax=Dothidotthia symphoricarpi CBS 119687 TaxID=1392245 RepID=A0A6A6A0G2_9PLEO|nr:uncharacterized protein P153DRAFT_324467 [Dothidotthia symphoricarpi CBS 119687]KAF2125300.1 hypothetical protein P153DRAFT_324467 [Dothidotthia symphoricarpi CBS 119687]
MALDEEESRTLLAWPYVQSKFDGDLKRDLEKWGWDDDEAKHKQSDAHCDFKDWHELGNVFDALGIDTRSKEMGGPNQCFFFHHQGGKAIKRGEGGKLPDPEEQRYEVEGKEYRVTGAYHRAGINPDDGIVYFLHRRSPEEGAKILWGVEHSDIADLPALRASSDLTWGLWNRVASKNLQHIEMFMVLSIVNEDTVDAIIPRALEHAKEKADEVKPWPGTDFVFGEGDDEADDAFYALLGSPNGLAVAYFLIQHKLQLGGANFVYKVTIFRGEDEDANPNFIFYVDHGEPPLREDDKGTGDRKQGGLKVDYVDLQDLGNVTNLRALKRSEDGKHILREHIL